MARSAACVILFGAGLLVAAGCEQKFPTIPVEGTVTKNGKPQNDIEVVFLADPDSKTVGPRATGKTDAAGRYRLQIEGGSPGAVPGTHRVLVLDLNAAKQMAPRGKGTMPVSPEQARRLEEEARKALRIPPNYGSINNTPLRATIGAQPVVFDIDIR
ncbi:hypothetical protein [Fimbriiglobus ruber]|uniref:Carboxypeptidase regulatory-like domain-containing protein n=1 Tax=Fimbriiglobus ruber TaxID=1908690 RepID=A0A225DHU2_9BACT|nr:hypothetical protein [Fimbriiglobus ruber]OWK35657.1 hypothetical protein FRUB_08220 [Fimbriiglobus ruber]